MTSGVYAIVNTATGMAYVGSSRTIEARWQAIRSCLKHDWMLAAPLRKAWRESAGVGFEFVVLEETPLDEAALLEAEQRWIDHYGDQVYNVNRIATRIPRAHRNPWSVPADWFWSEGRWRSPKLWVRFAHPGPPPEETFVIGNERRQHQAGQEQA